MAERAKVARVREIVPHLRDEVIERLLASCGNSLSRTVEAALEQGPESPVIVAQPVGSSTPLPAAPSITKASSHSSIADTFTESEPQTPSQSMKGSSRRGSAMSLPPTFLPIPDFRLSRHVITDSLIEFSIVYRRLNRSFGFSIQEIDGEIVVVNMDTQNFRKSLAVCSGVQIGDLIVGINDDECAFGTDTQDILELLQRSGQFITLHFRRRFCFSGRIDTAALHPALPFLAEQGLAKVDQVVWLDRMLRQLKRQCVLWDDDALTARVVAWELDDVLQDYWDDLVPAHGADAGKSPPPSLSAASSSSSSRRQSYSGREEKESLSRRISRRFSSSGVSDAARSPAPVASVTGRVFDASRSMKFVRPALAVHILRVESEKGTPFEDVELVLWCCDVRSEVEWVSKCRVLDLLELRRRLIKAKHRLAAVPFPTKRTTSRTTIENELLPAYQRFLREALSSTAPNPAHPSSVRVALLLQQFLGVREYMTQVTVQQLRTADAHSRCVQVHAHNVLQLPVFRDVSSTFVSEFMANKVKDVSAHWTEETAARVVAQLKTFMDGYQALVFSALRSDCTDIVAQLCQSGAELQGRTNDILRAIAQLSFLDSADTPVAECESLKLQAEDEIDGLIRGAVRKQVEVEVYIACMGRVKFVMQRAHEPQALRLAERVSHLHSQPQSFYDIAVDHISPCSWQPIVAALRDIKNYTLPCDRVQHLLQLCKTIHALFRAEHPTSSRPLGADDVFPIFIYVVVQARVPQFWTVNQELQLLCDPDKAFSEAGYYLATLQACLSHLLHVDVDAADRKAH